MSPEPSSAQLKPAPIRNWVKPTRGEIIDGFRVVTILWSAVFALSLLSMSILALGGYKHPNPIVRHALEFAFPMIGLVFGVGSICLYLRKWLVSATMFALLFGVAVAGFVAHGRGLLLFCLLLSAIAVSILGWRAEARDNPPNPG